jgi:4-alpha-glucanotransferase
MNKRFAGVAVPVFSLRSKKSFGTGEFSDMKLLIDWAVLTGLKAIQILPVNDTTSTGRWADSYPYSSISAFALHPLYIDLAKVARGEHADLLKSLQQDREKLNALADLEYEEVMKLKMETLKALYDVKKGSLRDDKKYKKFIRNNKDWIKPYAIYCSSRTKTTQGTPEFYYFVQYHLHLQLKEVSVYARKKGILLKGDIPIGVNKNSADTATFPSLFNMDMQAGAPPDFFSDKGQNWGFPTYNWKEMEKDNYKWWRQRLDHMSKYFDAFRLDHILGFFRIWSIPINSIDATAGRYIPPGPEKVWEKEGRNKLSVLKKATKMLVCGEDLGMVPACVPGVLKELKILSLEVQRMPKEYGIEFSNLKDAPYLSVVTPATHDMSTIREWWEEDRGKSQRFYNSILHHEGTAPYFCEPELVKEIITQHLKSPAMLAIFQVQDLMGMDGKLRRQMPQEERINQPANSTHQWKYRMHITLEGLMERKDFNNELRSLIKKHHR